MSSRALRRLQKQQLPVVEDLEHSDEEFDTTPQKNLFDLLNEGDDDADGQDEESKDDDENYIEQQRTPSPSPDKAASVSSSKKKKKKNNNKKKGKSEVKMISEMSMEELDKALKEVHDDSAAEVGQQKSLEIDSHERRSLLSISYRHLDAEQEMKRMFGSRVVNSESRNGGRVIKRSKLSTPKVDWPPYKKQGLSMELLETVNGISYFAFKHDEGYQDTQLEFLSVVATHNPNTLMALYHHHPYHVDCLLQISEIAKHSGDWANAGECVERALYACERAFHPHFTFGSGTVRLSYKRAENRSLFLAIFRHIQFLARRGCWRTAFEFNKLLFSLDPEVDPLGALLSMDAYALSAREYEFVIRMGTVWKTGGSIYPVDLMSMPNFAYSTAYAEFKLSSTGEASKTLKKAMREFPLVVPRLLEKLGESGAINDQPFLLGAPTPYLELLESEVVERTHELYKEPEVLAWFKETARSISGQLEAPRRELECVDHASVPLNVSRHVIVSEIQNLLSFLPSQVTGSSFHMYDPLPPPDSELGYDLDDRMRTNPRQSQRGLLEVILENMGLNPQMGDDQMALVRQMVEQQMHMPDRIPGAFPEDEEERELLDELLEQQLQEAILADQEQQQDRHRHDDPQAGP